MQLVCELKMSLIAYHKEKMQELVLDKTVIRRIKENSEEFKELCATHKETIGFERENDKEKFDSKLLELMSEEATQEEVSIISSILDTFKKCHTSEKRIPAYIQFSGCILDPNDFCAIKINDFKTNLRKEV